MAQYPFHNLLSKMWNHYPSPKSESRLYGMLDDSIVYTFCFVECGIENVPQFIEKNVESFIPALEVSLDYTDSMHPKCH